MPGAPVACDDCGGVGQCVDILGRGAFTCPRCSGSGVMPAVILTWIAKGNEYRRRRMAAGIGLREGADMIGILASLLSDVEAGMVENSRATFPW